jgi:hypothetical protein
MAFVKDVLRGWRHAVLLFQEFKMENGGTPCFEEKT